MTHSSLKLPSELQCNVQMDDFEKDTIAAKLPELVLNGLSNENQTCWSGRYDVKLRMVNLGLDSQIGHDAVESQLTGQYITLTVTECFSSLGSVRCR